MILHTFSIAALACSSIQDTAKTDAAPAQWTQGELEAVCATISAEIEEMRGQKFLRPVTAKLTNAQGFFEYAKKRMAETQSKSRTVRDETIAKLLGLVPPTMDLEATMLDLLKEQVGGFYDPGSNTFYLMDTFTGGVAKVIISHELTHALDDQHFDIDGTLKKLHEESDAELAFQSVVEGSGTAAMAQWFVKHTKEVSIADLSRAQSLGADALKDAPPFLWKPLLAVYLQGSGFIGAAGQAQAPAVAAAFREPPRSMEQILHPDKYWKADKRDEPVRVRFDTKHLPEGWTVLGEDTLGEFMLGLVTTPRAERDGLDASNSFAMLGLKYTTEPAKGWGGDRALLVGQGDDRVLYLATVWDTPQDATEFADALRSVAFDLIPLFAAAGARDSAQGWRASVTPTWSHIEASTSPGGRGAVFVRVGSFASADGRAVEAIQGFALPWTDVVEPR